MTKFKTPINLLGELERGYPINVIGAPMAGKTLLALQMAFQETKGNILMLDADGGAVIFTKKWIPRFQTRYQREVTPIILPSWSKKHTYGNQKEVKFEMRFLQNLGIDARAEISENGKTEFVPRGVFRPETDVMKIIKDRKIGMLVVDSFSQVFKEVFVGTQSFGSRARAEDMSYGMLKEIGLEFPELLIFVNHHQSANPIRGTIDASGGKSVIHNCKLALFLEKMTSKKFEGLGKMWVYRAPDIPEWGKFDWFRYTGEGMVDVDYEKEVKPLEQPNA